MSGAGSGTVAGEIQLVWFRHDLRVRDNGALRDALAAGPTAACFCVCEKQWRSHDVGDRRLAFLLRALGALRDELERLNVPLRILHTPWFEEVPQALAGLCDELGVGRLYFNDEYPLNERRRDAAVASRAERDNVRVRRYSGTVTLPPGSVLTQNGKPYTVYTPFRRRWGELVGNSVVRSGGDPSRQPAAPCTSNPLPVAFDGVGADLDAERWPAGETVAAGALDDFVEQRIERYHRERNLPALAGTSRLAHHLSVGALSPNQCLALAGETDGGLASEHPGRRQWINEVVWREFYRHIIAQFDHVSRGQAFRVEYDRLRWLEPASELAAWQEGRTGYPLVDAAMRCLITTGWMHNRLRMVCAMFLSKHLLIDWREGERFFMRHLIDGDFASNNGGWQWSASTGTDAAPYFRIFNPASQGRKFDPKGVFTRQWVPALADLPDRYLFEAPSREGVDYPEPIVEHGAARQRALAFFKKPI